MACGDKYRHLLVTPSGLTPDNPCGMLCSAFDWEDWHGVVRDRVMKQATLHWAAAERAALAQGVTLPANLAEERAALAQSFEDLPDYWWEPDWSRPLESYKSAVNRLVRVGENGVCFLENVDGYIEELGATPPAVPGVSTSTPFDWTTAAIWGGGLLAVGIGAYYGVRYVRTRKGLAA